MRKKRKVKKARKRKPYIVDLGKELWLAKNFLVPLEKRALIMFYRDRINKILEATKNDDTRELDVECEHDIKRFSERMKFIVDHF